MTIRKVGDKTMSVVIGEKYVSDYDPWAVVVDVRVDSKGTPYVVYEYFGQDGAPCGLFAVPEALFLVNYRLRPQRYVVEIRPGVTGERRITAFGRVGVVTWHQEQSQVVLAIIVGGDPS